MTQPARRSLLLGHVVVIICSIAIQLCNVLIATNIDHYLRSYYKIAAFSYLGLMFLSYPLLGYIADVCLTRYRTLKCSFIFLIAACSIGSLFTIIYTGIILRKIVLVQRYKDDEEIEFVGTAIAGILITIGAGLFEANAIQFGLDQLLEAPTPKLIAFIHWYYWTQNAMQLVATYVSIGWIVADKQLDLIPPFNAQLVRDISVLTATALIGIVSACSIVLLHKSKRHLYILRAGLNPFKNIYKVLKYSWNHKVPQHRSAFTYWEEDIPRRIDLGKNKYGGPFTNEEVEDTKTFLRILPLLLCLFGYHLAGDGYSAPDQLLRTSCSSLPVLLLIVLNPLHISTLVVVVGIPLYRLIINKCSRYIKKVRMLTKMWIGLYLSLVQIVLYIIVVINHDSKYWSEHSSVACVLNDSSFYRYNPGRVCFNIRLEHTFSPESCELPKNPVEPVVHHSSAPQWSLFSACLHDSV